MVDIGIGARGQNLHPKRPANRLAVPSRSSSDGLTGVSGVHEVIPIPASEARVTAHWQTGAVRGRAGTSPASPARTARVR